jgi:preprotein translocase subunit SecE
MQPTKNEKPKITEGIQRYFRNVMAELKKVNWPNRKELTTYTIVVIANVLVFSAIISLWDFLLSSGFRAMGLWR